MHENSNENFLTLSQAAKLLPHHPHRSTLWRWHRRGVLARNGKRVRLKCRRFGGTALTTAEWLDEFGCALAEADQEGYEQRQEQRRANSRPRKRLAVEDDERALAEVGI